MFPFFFKLCMTMNTNLFINMIRRTKSFFIFFAVAKCIELTKKYLTSIIIDCIYKKIKFKIYMLYI